MREDLPDFRSNAPLEQPIDFVTVVYRGEIDLLRLQARSLACFFPADQIGEILVVLNDWDLDALETAVESVRDGYGPHSAKLRIVRPGDILNGPQKMRDIPGALRFWLKYASRALRGRKQGWRGSSGWLMQQALKLAAARRTQNPYLVYLDAKNQFIAPADGGAFFAPDGTPRALLERVQDNYFEWHCNARRFLGFSEPARDAALMPSITPFACQRATVLKCLDVIETKAGAVDYFFAPKSPRGTEFTLLAAVAAGDAADCSGAFATGLLPFFSIFRDASDARIAQMFEAARSGAVGMLGTHSGRMAEFTLAQREALHELWRARGLDPAGGVHGG